MYINVYINCSAVSLSVNILSNNESEPALSVCFVGATIARQLHWDLQMSLHLIAKYDDKTPRHENNRSHFLLCHGKVIRG